MKRYLGITITAACAIVFSISGAMAQDVPSSGGTSAKFRSFPDFADLVEKASPAVVNIRTTEKITIQQSSQGFSAQDQAEFFRRFFGIPAPTPPAQGQTTPAVPQSQELQRGTGSGFIIDSSGYILTNAHVVEGATTIYVTLTDHREFRAKLIGTDRRSDIALVKVEGTGLPKLALGDSSKARVGEWVLAIGSPFGLENSVSAGILSAKGRENNDTILPFLQTDVAINPGNSGGPLLNTRGEVIGINSQIYSRSGGYMGISFAIPIDEAIRIADQLKANGRIARGRIGISISEVSKEVADSMGTTAHPKGALVKAVEPGAPAANAGIEAGDVIVKINDRDVDKPTELTRAVSDTKPGSRIKLLLWHKGSNKEIVVTVTDLDPARKP